MYYNKVEICGVNTSNLKVLSDSEKKELLKRTKAGDMKAREELIYGNLRLVLSIIQRFSNRNESVDDLFQVGCVGLIKAVDTFRVSKGAKFATYAARCIQNEILMHFRAQKKLAAEVSVDDAIDVDRDGNPLTYIDVISCDEDIPEQIGRKICSEKALRLVKTLLDERERRIISMRYGLTAAEPMTQREVAQRLGISRSYVSRIEKSALDKLSAALKG